MVQTSVASHSLCWCRCESRASYWWGYHNNNLTNEEKTAILDVEIRRIRSELLVEKKVLSSYVRARTSVQDERTSAESMGYLGIVLLSTIVGLFVLSDCLKLISFLFNKSTHWLELFTKIKMFTQVANITFIQIKIRCLLGVFLLWYTNI